jgi:5-amino-6-(5-phospho-D-ribitylamino)uracil phosphatase
MSHAKWRLIALDMDGTTLDKDGRISEENRTWIHAARQAGIEVTFATGRHLNGIVRTYVEDLGLKVPVVTVNGGEVWTTEGDLLSRSVFTTDEIGTLYDLAHEMGLSYWGGTVDGMFQMHDLPSQVEESVWLKFGFFGKDERVIQRVWNQLKNDGRFEVTNSHPLNIEVNPKGVSKAVGLQVVCDYLGIEAGQVVTMGDGMNDVEMLRWAGLGIAMGNAQNVVKESADFVTSRFDENGVAAAIQKYVMA